MGDFDRSQEAAPANGKNKQVYIAIGLAVVLVSVLGHQLLGGGPQAASALTFNGASAGGTDADTAKTPEQAAAMLRDDPTAQLLRGSPVSDHSWDAMPRNPFVMSENWRAGLVRAVPAAAPAEVAVKPQATTPVAEPLKSENYRLDSIFRQGDSYSAIVNGRIVKAGMVIGAARVVGIRDDRIILQGVDSPSAPATEFFLERRNK
jgi:hypothetical protein